MHLIRLIRELHPTISVSRVHTAFPQCYRRFLLLTAGRNGVQRARDTLTLLPYVSGSIFQP